MSAPITPDLKLRLETEKLQVEIANLKKTWIKNPASWVSILTIVVALCGLAFQYRSQKAEALEAQVKLEKAQAEFRQSQERLKYVENELKNKEPRLNQVLEEIDRATTDLKQLTSDREKVETQLVALNNQIKDLETKAKNLPTTADNQQIQTSVKNASASVASLRIANQAIVEKSIVVTDRLDASKFKRAFPHQ